MTQVDNGLEIEPSSRLTDEQRDEIRAHRAELLQALEVEWEILYTAALRQITEVLDDADLVRWVALRGGELHLNDEGQLRCWNADAVPEPVRQVVRQRQERLTELLARGPPEVRQLDMF